MFSAKVARIPPPYTVDELMQATMDLVRANQQRSAYVRPIMFRGYNTLGVDGRGCPWKQWSPRCPGAPIWARKGWNRAWMCR